MEPIKISWCNENICCADVDLSRRNGLLNFTHELTVNLTKKDDIYEFLIADEITPDGWVTYETKEELDEVYPTVYDDILEAIKNE
jgi:hypothetical protein